MYKKVGSFFFLSKKKSTNGVSKLFLNARRKKNAKKLDERKKNKVKSPRNKN